MVLAGITCGAWSGSSSTKDQPEISTATLPVLTSSNQSLTSSPLDSTSLMTTGEVAPAGWASAGSGDTEVRVVNAMAVAMVRAIRGRLVTFALLSQHAPGRLTCTPGAIFSSDTRTVGISGERPVRSG